MTGLNSARCCEIVLTKNNGRTASSKYKTLTWVIGFTYHAVKKKKDKPKDYKFININLFTVIMS